jgi:hypothetical protein
LLAKGYDYWALGHVHCRESVNKAEHVRVEFPGNTQGRHIRETGAKGCLLVSVDAHRRTQPEFRALDVFRWAHTAVDATQAESIADVTSATLMALEPHTPRRLCIRLNARGGDCGQIRDRSQKTMRPQSASSKTASPSATGAGKSNSATSFRIIPGLNAANRSRLLTRGSCWRLMMPDLWASGRPGPSGIAERQLPRPHDPPSILADRDDLETAHLHGRQARLLGKPW